MIWWFFRILSSDPTTDALMRTTTAVTMVSGGIKVCTEIPIMLCRCQWRKYSFTGCSWFVIEWLSLWRMVVLCWYATFCIWYFKSIKLAIVNVFEIFIVTNFSRTSALWGCDVVNAYLPACSFSVHASDTLKYHNSFVIMSPSYKVSVWCLSQKFVV